MARLQRSPSTCGASSSGWRCSFGAERLIIVLTFWMVFASSFVAARSSGGGPHPHRGVVKPFQSGDPKVTIPKSALAQLRKGQPYKTQIQDGSAGRGLVVQDVDAPSNIVWGRILDFDHYHQMVPKTVESKTYKKESVGRGNKQRIWVAMKVGFPLLKLQFFINHLYDPALHSLTWTLDYNRKSDLDDSCGYWYVIPHPEDPTHKTRVFYSVEVSMFPWVPQFVVDFMSKQALTDATAWVKKYSEIEAAKLAPATKKQSSSSLENSADNVAVGVRKIGITRYALVFSILSLVLYNVHLYFSQ